MGLPAALPLEAPAPEAVEPPLSLQPELAKHSAPRAPAAKLKNSERKTELQNAGVYIEH
jgi:hypothetical protein